MKFVKENLVLVICGAVVVIALALWFFVVNSARDSWQAEVATYYNGANANISRMNSTRLEIPGSATVAVGIPTANFIEAKLEANKKMAGEAETVKKLAAEANSGGRVVFEGNNVIPLLGGKNGKREIGYLPRNHGTDPMQYKADLSNALAALRIKLVGKDVPATPPLQTDLSAEFMAQQALRTAQMPGGMAVGPFAGVDAASEERDFYRRRIMGRASQIWTYLDDTAMTPRGSWLESLNPPSDQEIFESLVDTWLKSDVVSAIAAVNDFGLKNKPKEQQNVSFAPIKRVMLITVGNNSFASRLGSFGTNANGGGGSNPGTSVGLFFLPAAITVTASDTDTPAGADTDTPPPPPAQATAIANTIDPLRSMTGRASGSDYDVVMIQVCMDIDPAYLNRFTDELYRLNMGYTVLRTKWRAVDPLERASSGYVYGDTQVVEVELLVESLLFRNWTQPLMPTNIRNQLQIPPDAPKPTP